MMPNKRKCKSCSTYTREYIVINNMAFCDKTCAVDYAVSNQEKGRAKIKQAKSKEIRERKKSLRTKSWYVKKAQGYFNSAIRERDKNRPCISCGRGGLENKYGGSWDCGHYKTVGAFPELRFEPLNAHRQCKSCNAGSSKYSMKGKTVSQDYTERLIKRIGQEKVDWLNGHHEAKRYTKEDLTAIAKYYREQVKLMESDPTHELESYQ